MSSIDPAQKIELSSFSASRHFFDKQFEHDPVDFRSWRWSDEAVVVWALRNNHKNKSLFF
jgi:hypothetical protein